MKRILLFFVTVFINYITYSQVGIGTTTPKASAILEINSTSKGFLPPRMTTVQRNAIVNPSHGLHVFNTDEKCLNYYDSLTQVWSCYCPSCGETMIYIATSTTNLDFYATYAQYIPATKYTITILPGVTISGGDSALKFTRMTFNAAITINNYGTIVGIGGKGGSAAEQATVTCGGPMPQNGEPGGRGGCAIGTKSGVTITVKNYGIIAGGGGGGGGGMSTGTVLGGGGGSGAGIPGGNIGYGGAHSTVIAGECTPAGNVGANGTMGQATTGGTGGAGANGGVSGGNGGVRGQSGTNGGGTLGGIGGPAGKAIGGGSGNILNNLNAGQRFGLVD